MSVGFSVSVSVGFSVSVSVGFSVSVSVGFSVSVSVGFSVSLSVGFSVSDSDGVNPLFSLSLSVTTKAPEIFLVYLLIKPVCQAVVTAPVTNITPAKANYINAKCFCFLLLL